MLSRYVGIVVVILSVSTRRLNGSVFFPANSAYGIFAAIAVPLDLGPHRNVYVSYNFEANYNLPANWQLPSYLQLDSGDLRGMKGKHEPESVGSSNVTDGVLDTDSTTTNSSFTGEEDEKNDKSRVRRSLLSRNIFYNILKQKLQMHGYNGEKCLLRMICETNDSGIGDINGFLGSVIHIIFAPSSSRDEGISEIYYKAEFDGQQSECAHYREKCPENILDFFSTPVHETINSLRKK